MKSNEFWKTNKWIESETDRLPNYLFDSFFTNLLITFCFYFLLFIYILFIDKFLLYFCYIKKYWNLIESNF